MFENFFLGLAFGLVSMVNDCLELYTFVELSNISAHCFQWRFAFYEAVAITFTFVQMHFVFMNSKVSPTF